MRNRNLLSLGLLSVLAAAGAAAFTVVGCSGDDAATDAGSDSPVADQNNPPPDTGTPDTGVDAGPPRARLTMVHASLAAPAVRICFAIRSTTDAGSVDTVTPFPPLPDQLTANQKAAGLPYPGLFPGTGGGFPDTGSNLEPLTIVPYLLVASKVAQFSREDGGTPRGCDEILKAGDAGAGLVENVDYFKLAAIPAGTFQAGKSFVIAAVGCPAGQGNNAAGKAKCGLAYDDTSNLAARVYEVSKTVPSAQASGAQFLHLSPVVGAGFPGGVKASIVQGDAAAPINATASNYLDNPAPTPPAQVTLTASGTLSLAALAADGGPGTTIPVPLAAVSQVSTGGTTFAYVSGTSYTFIAVGDPNQPQYINPLDGGPLAPDAGGRFNGYTLHALGFPNEFTPSKL